VGIISSTLEVLVIKLHIMGRETDHSSPPNAEVKDDGAIPLLPIRIHGVVLN
jgi:hypothetical protein